MGLVAFNKYGAVTSSPAGISAFREETINGNKAVVTAKYNFNDYSGDSGIINGTIVLNMNYDSLSDMYCSSSTGSISLTIKQDDIMHTLSATGTVQIDKNTGSGKSEVETGSFDGAKYRITTIY